MRKTQSNADRTQELILTVTAQLENLAISLKRIEDLEKEVEDLKKQSAKAKNPPIEEFKVGDPVIISHYYKSQHGIQGTVIQVSKCYVWFKSNKGKTYQKHKTNVKLDEDN